MVLAGRFHPRVARNVRGGVLSAALHVGLLFVIISGGREDGTLAGAEPTGKLVLLRAPESARTDAAELRRLEPAVPTTPTEEELQATLERLAPALIDAIVPHAEEPVPPSELPPDMAESLAPRSIVPATIPMSHAESAALAQRLERLLEESLETSAAEVAWEQDGKKYSAVLIRERASDGTALERVIAEISAADGGKRLITRVGLNRLAFSQFTQMVDRWDPMVQLHDDEIVGRFHTNSRFNLMYDSRIAPKLLGKVTTAAGSFSTEARGRRRQSDIFQGGVQTRTQPIHLPESLGPFEWAPKDGNARIHEFESDARIRFYANGTYTWRTPDSPETRYVDEPAEHPVYFVAARGITLHVKGVVAGKVLIYSPHRIVIEGSLTYANDPRDVPDSHDYLGLVCDRYVEVAPPSVTGPGDLEIDAAIFAGRRFLVRNIDRPRTGTLRIYGSLTAGTLSATEPRYATRIDYDSRFERRRPPGFPSTNRYEVDEEWHGQWTEVR